MSIAHRSVASHAIHDSKIFLQRPMVNLRLTFTPPVQYCSGISSRPESSSSSPTPLQSPLQHYLAAEEAGARAGEAAKTLLSRSGAGSGVGIGEGSEHLERDPASSRPAHSPFPHSSRQRRGQGGRARVTPQVFN